MNRFDLIHIEVVQAIQSADNPPYMPCRSCHLDSHSRGIPLITGKRTFARMYFDGVPAERAVRLEGALVAAHTDADGNRVVNRVSCMDPLDYRTPDPVALMEQRQNWDRSLNFELPPASIAQPGNLEIRLEALSDTLSGTSVTPGGRHDATVELQQVAPLVCRALAIDYRDQETGEYVGPSHEEVDVVRRYVERAFPVASLNWSSARIEADHRFTSLRAVREYRRSDDEAASRMLSILLTQVLAHRNQEIGAGRDANTLYIGLISDPNGRFGGVAMDSPAFPTTHSVAISAVDTTGETAAHELAHLLGCHHPGIPDIYIHGHALGQFEVDRRAQKEMGSMGYLSGQNDCSHPETLHLGLDADPSSSRPRVLQHGRWFDLMTYRYPQWLSAYNYRKIFDRLKCISHLSLRCAESTNWTAICSYDLDRKQARFLHVLRTDHLTPQHPEAFENVSELAGTRALDHLFWLQSTSSIFTSSQWSAILGLLEAEDATRVRAGDCDDDASHQTATPIATVDAYNRLMRGLEDHGHADILEKLDANHIVRKLVTPQIRVHIDHGDGDVADCMERDAERLWSRATEVYYRRVGDPARYPFGLFQFTIPGRGPLAAPPRSVTLLVNGVVVDKLAQSLSGDHTRLIAKSIHQLLDETYGIGGRPPHSATNGGAPTPTASTPVHAYTDPRGAPPSGRYENDPEPNCLAYDIGTDSYHLYYQWPDFVVDRVGEAQREPDNKTNRLATTVTTTILCRRPCPPDAGNWDVVWVSDQLEGRVKIDSGLMEHQLDKEVPRCRRRPSSYPSSRPVGDRLEDTLTFKVELSVGFDTFTSDEIKAKPVPLTPRRERFFREIRATDSGALSP